MALDEAMKSLEYIKKVPVCVDNLGRIGPVYQIVGEGLVANKRYDEALEYYDESIKIKSQIPARALSLNFLVFPYVGKAFCFWRKGGAENISKASILLEEICAGRQELFKDEPSLR